MLDNLVAPTDKQVYHCKLFGWDYDPTDHTFIKGDNIGWWVSDKNGGGGFYYE